MEIELLSHLASTEDYVNLSDYFKNNYPNHAEISMDIKVMLDELSPERKFIRMTEIGDYTILGSINNNGVITFDTFDNLGFKISAKITMKGREYLRDFIRNEKQDKLNASFKNLNDVTTPNNNKRMQIITGVILLSSVVYTLTAIEQCNILQHNQQSEVFVRKIKTLLSNPKTNDSLIRKGVKEILGVP